MMDCFALSALLFFLLVGASLQDLAQRWLKLDHAHRMRELDVREAEAKARGRQNDP